jgi:VWA-like domain (DUF2201)
MCSSPWLSGRAESWLGEGITRRNAQSHTDLRATTLNCTVPPSCCSVRHQITQVNTYESWETPDSLKPEDFRGRGGTDFRPVFDWIREKVLPVEGWPDLLAYLTDAQGPFPDNLPAYPVVWLLPQTARVIPPLGMKIEIPPH